MGYLKIPWPPLAQSHGKSLGLLLLSSHHVFDSFDFSLSNSIPQQHPETSMFPCCTWPCFGKRKTFRSLNNLGGFASILFFPEIFMLWIKVPEKYLEERVQERIWRVPNSEIHTTSLNLIAWTAVEAVRQWCLGQDEPGSGPCVTGLVIHSDSFSHPYPRPSFFLQWLSSLGFFLQWLTSQPFPPTQGHNHSNFSFLLLSH